MVYIYIWYIILYQMKAEITYVISMSIVLFGYNP